MPELVPETIEQLFADAEQKASDALKLANTITNQLKKYQAAAKAGKVRDMNAAREQLVQLTGRFDQEIRELATPVPFDEKAYLEDGRYTAELIAAASDAGILITEGNGRLYCYPALIRVLPEERAVRIDKKAERSLRPSYLTSLLGKMQKQPVRFRAGAFLEALYQAYELAVQSKSSRRIGSVIQLRELYRLLTLLPGASSDYSLQEFGRDIYLLDQSREALTRKGMRLEFHVGAGAAIPAGAMTVVTQSGAEKVYHGLTFVETTGVGDVN